MSRFVFFFRNHKDIRKNIVLFLDWLYECCLDLLYKNSTKVGKDFDIMQQGTYLEDSYKIFNLSNIGHYFENNNFSKVL